ncbi:MAG: DUF2080 family transposase-associated protein [Candidatus Methanomethylophilaceae archaeon]|nr:DUF2080 family transposase-associated protein [Candidatus Methanomethylophilaceae archaeon]
MESVIEIRVEGKDILKKIVKDTGESGAVYLPRDLIGKEVVVVVLK